jgi:hypothetical protein
MNILELANATVAQRRLAVDTRKNGSEQAASATGLCDLRGAGRQPRSADPDTD